MSLNLTNKTAYHQFDEFGMLIVPSDELSWRDSLGRTILAGLAYGFTTEIKRSINSCYLGGRLYRHPGFNEESSRDHWSYFIMFRKLITKDATQFLNFIDRVPRMRGLNLWMNALTGDKRAEWWYYTLAIPGAYIGNWWLRKCRKWGRISLEMSNRLWLSLGNFRLSNRTRWQKLWAWIIFQSMPAYALHNKAWQIYVMPASRKKEKLKRILLSRIGISNIMLRLLLGDTVTQEEIDAYPDMTGYRPGVYLDETCRRDIRELTDKEAEFNCYEKQLIILLWKQRQKSLLIRLMEEDEELY